jgi:hypothetical protein
LAGAVLELGPGSSRTVGAVLDRDKKSPGMRSGARRSNRLGVTVLRACLGR